MPLISAADVARPREQTARRRNIIAAARRAIVARGVRGLRVKDVAAQAGISAGLVSYYFPELDRLLVDVHQDSVDRFYWGRLRTIEGLADGAARLRALVAGGLPVGADDEICHCLYELHLHAARDETHAGLMTDLFDREVALYASVLRRGEQEGEFVLSAPAEDVAATAVVLEDAYGLHIVARNRSIDRRRAATLLLSCLGTMTGTVLLDPGCSIG
ncbi:TetR/AcrR family transcriptional regulator [Geodermatophilus poikilotrophus]|uniref:DNA-binding transcriptional regulator YbjK n=1 Tax=Geodermatophilus poikilotrophus TaxID=1333667 RepID=A0A1H9YWL7_9ACTN|nr:TetR/AcrR family transcriptional regulator [Geodermatophilus poikilotrophus]SES73512.1 DNA-binding transcriptional regulator YbjK [Geodermatophilus poikilotrophus]